MALLVQGRQSAKSGGLPPHEPRMLRLVLIALLAIFVKPIKAETWPSRPLTMVVPFATGGPMDAIARILQSALADALQEQVIVENVGGAGGMIGAARVARSAPDRRQTDINLCSAMSARTP
jgi:tripartite-type tricarboxylate transporter receptor subunit TctC